MPISRRNFLSAAVVAPWLRHYSVAVHGDDSNDNSPTLDLHVHLFGVGDNNTGCRMSPKITQGLQFQTLVYLLGVRQLGVTIDQGYERVLAKHVDASGLTKTAILGQDGVYDRHGKPDWDRTSFYIPNDYVFDVVGRHKNKMIACPSINPVRRDAAEELNRVHEKGARLIKIHPPTQGVDLSHRRHKPFFRRCAELDVLVLVHTGHEHSAPVISKHFAAPSRLEPALDEGCRVVACHSGSGWPTDKPDQLPQFIDLIDRYPNRLWGDTAVLGTAFRVRDFERLLAIDRVRDRLLHGSDFPFPISPVAFKKNIGAAEAKRIGNERNWIKRDLELKEAMGIGLISARRAFEVVMGKPPQAQSHIQPRCKKGAR